MRVYSRYKQDYIKFFLQATFGSLLKEGPHSSWKNIRVNRCLINYSLTWLGNSTGIKFIALLVRQVIIIFTCQLQSEEVQSRFAVSKEKLSFQNFLIQVLLFEKNNIYQTNYKTRWELLMRKIIHVKTYIFGCSKELSH